LRIFCLVNPASFLKVPSPHAFTFPRGLDLRTFAGNLHGYKKRMEDYEKFKASNPDFDKQAPEPLEPEIVMPDGWSWLKAKFWP